MTDEPYRWLEAIANRREYVLHQLEHGSPVFALSRPEGVLMLGVGTGHSKVFEVFDRHALGALGHPADIERIRQQVIDAAHLEGFARAAEDVSLRRLISFGLGPELKASFEKLFAPPYLVRLLFAELASAAANDLLGKVHFDGTFTLRSGGVAVIADDPAREAPVEAWLSARLTPDAELPAAAQAALTAWNHLVNQADLPAAGADLPNAETLLAALGERVLEAGWLKRDHRDGRAARYHPLGAGDLGLSPAVRPA